VKIKADRSACIGSGMCVLTAPAVFDQDDEEGLVVLLVEQPSGADAQAALAAVQLCPAQALARSADEQPGQ
jgi:ferredoxin